MSRDNVRIVQDLYEASARGELSAMLEHLAPDFIAHESDALPFGGVYRGPEGFTRLVQGVSGLFHLNTHVEELVDSVIIDGNRAVTEQRMTIVKADGTRIVMPFNTNHFHFEGDLIKTLRVMGSPA